MIPELKRNLHRIRFIFCLFIAYVSQGHGLQFSLERDSDGPYCGRLQCVADKKVSTYILSIYQLTIYNITQPNDLVKISSASLFPSDLHTNDTQVKVIAETANVSKAEVTVAILNENDCLYGSFMCELDFVNTSAQTDVIKEFIAPRAYQNETFGAILNTLNAITQQFKTLSDVKARQNEADGKIAALETKLNETALKMGTLETKLHNVTDHLSSLKASKQTCIRGGPHASPREPILLWDTTWTLCDTEADGGGWIVIQRRAKGDTDFFRHWNYYKNGFGNPYTDFWIGNDVIHNLTSQGYTELRIDVGYDGMRNYTHYSQFNVADENSKYKMTVSGYTGPDTDIMTFYNGADFATYDKDYGSNGHNCSVKFQSAWWYDVCRDFDINGQWGISNKWPATNKLAVLTFSELKIRQV